MDNFNFNLLKYFYYIVLYNGFTNASRNLNVAQPSLSLSVKKLEDELGYKLIDRNSKKFVVTEDGRNLYENIKSFFENIEKNLNLDNSLKKNTEINIGIRFSYSFLLGPEVIRSIIDSFPLLKINIRFYSKLDVNKLKEKDYDIVIDDMDYLKLMDDVNIEAVASINNYFVCSSELYNMYSEIESITELDQAKLISYNPSLKLGKFNKLCFENNISFIDTISVNESDLFFDYINNNLGIALTNELYLKKYNNLKIINVKENIFKDEVGIAYINRSDTNTRLINLIKNKIKERI